MTGNTGQRGDGLECPACHQRTRHIDGFHEFCSAGCPTRNEEGDMGDTIIVPKQHVGDRARADVATFKLSPERFVEGIKWCFSWNRGDDKQHARICKACGATDSLVNPNGYCGMGCDPKRPHAYEEEDHSGECVYCGEPHATHPW